MIQCDEDHTLYTCFLYIIIKIKITTTDNWNHGRDFLCSFQIQIKKKMFVN